MLSERFEAVRRMGPRIHAITNVVTVNDCANVLLAAGAYPIMSDTPEEAQAITEITQGLTLNIGTLNASTVQAMTCAAKAAHALGHPIVLDPVGAGASSFRTDTALHLLTTYRPTVVRGNASELKALATNEGSGQGVDVAADDQTSEATLGRAVAWANAVAQRFHVIVAMTGAIDIVSDGETAYAIRNGHPAMGKVTGTGCQLSVLMTAFLAANPSDQLEAAVAAVAAMGLAGEVGRTHLEPWQGNASLRTAIIDALSQMTGDALDRGARCERLTRGL